MRGLWALLVLFLAAQVAAAPGTIQGTAKLPLQLTGDHASSGHGTFVLSGATGDASLLATGTGSATRIIHRAYGVVTHPDPQAEVMWNQRVEHQALDLAGSTLTLTGRLDGFEFVAFDMDASLTDGPTHGPQLVGGVVEPLSIDQNLERPLSVNLLTQAEPFHRDIAAGNLAVRAEDGRFVVDGPYSFWIQDAHARMAGSTQADLLASVRTESRPGGVYNPLSESWTGPGNHDEFIQETLLVQGNGHLELQYNGLPATLYAEPATFDVLGDIQVPGMTGTVTVTDHGQSRVHDIRDQAVTVSGKIHLQASDPSADASRVKLHGDGDVTRVAYGAVEAAYDWTKTLATVGFGAALVAAGIWVASQAKTMLAGAAGTGLVTGYARVHGPAILEHPVRAQIYERIKANPGITLAQLAEDARLGASTLTHHLRHLERNEFVTLLRDGRYMRLFDRQSGSFAGERKKAAAALSNPVSAAMARHIQAHPGVGQSELAAAFNVTASTVSWHMERLQAVGLVQKQRDAARTRYFLGDAWAHLPQDSASAPPAVAVAAMPAA